LNTSNFEAVAPTIAYDGRIMGTTMSGSLLPGDRWATISTPVLVMHGTGTFPSLITAARAGRAPADRDPAAGRRQGKDHSAEADVLAPTLRQFTKGQ
jgi:hypothetical protein